MSEGSAHSVMVGRGVCDLVGVLLLKAEKSLQRALILSPSLGLGLGAGVVASAAAGVCGCGVRDLVMDLAVRWLVLPIVRSCDDRVLSLGCGSSAGGPSSSRKNFRRLSQNFPTSW